MQFPKEQIMKTKVAQVLLLIVVVCSLISTKSFAATTATAAVTPAITVAGNKVFLHTAISNVTVGNEAVTVTLNISNPGTCVTGHLPPQAGAFAFGLRSNETRFADLSLDIPASACSGTYGVMVVVRNGAGTVLASHTAKFTVTIPTP
jgi:hypothetical protein